MITCTTNNCWIRHKFNINLTKSSNMFLYKRKLYCLKTNYNIILYRTEQGVHLRDSLWNKLFIMIPIKLWLTLMNETVVFHWSLNRNGPSTKIGRSGMCVCHFLLEILASFDISCNQSTIKQIHLQAWDFHLKPVNIKYKCTVCPWCRPKECEISPTPSLKHVCISFICVRQKQT